MTVANSQSLFAKLLATENITVKRDGNAKTAAFDIKSRTLFLPVWQGISNDLEDMLIVHEVGHALDTPLDGWMDGVAAIAKRAYGDKAPSRATNAIRNFINVVEDARIDKRQKRRYPGSRRNYLVGYKELIERDFFGTSKRDVNSMQFIDRINIYFKGGVSLGVKFSKIELPFIKRIENAETFEEVLVLSEEIFLMAKEAGENYQNTQSFDDLIFSEDGEEEFDGDFDGDFDDFEFEENENGKIFDNANKNGKGRSSSEDEEGSSDGEEGSSDGEDADENGDKDKESADSKKNAGAGAGVNDDFVPDSQTESTWQEKQKNIVNDGSVIYNYVTMPKPNLANVVDDYPLFLSSFAAYLDATKDWVDAVSGRLNQFKTEEAATISFMVKEFEMRKSADTYSRISIAKTGVIDTNKLHSYKHNDDIFRRLSVLPNGKNHGFVMFLDWSGSMASQLRKTLKQLFSLTMFCKRVQIPFEVYIFRSPSCDPKGAVFGRESKSSFNFKTGDLNMANFRMRCILSSRMNAPEMNKAMLYLWIMANHSHLRGTDQLNGTPLNQAIVTAIDLVNNFRAKNKVQIVNTIFLTDGESDPASSVYGNLNGRVFPDEYWTKGKMIHNVFILQDEVTKKNYEFTFGGVTIPLLKILKDRTGCNLIGFYLFGNGWSARGTTHHIVTRTFFPNSNPEFQEIVKRSWNDDKFVSVKTSGYDDYFIINSEGMNIENKPFTVDTGMTKNKIAKAFMEFSGKKSVNRVLLRRFIDLIATDKKVA